MPRPKKLTRLLPRACRFGFFVCSCPFKKRFRSLLPVPVSAVSDCLALNLLLLLSAFFWNYVANRIAIFLLLLSMDLDHPSSTFTSYCLGFLLIFTASLLIHKNKVYDASIPKSSLRVGSRPTTKLRIVLFSLIVLLDPSWPVLFTHSIAPQSLSSHHLIVSYSSIFFWKYIQPFPPCIIGLLLSPHHDPFLLYTCTSNIVVSTSRRILIPIQRPLFIWSYPSRTSKTSYRAHCP